MNNTKVLLVGLNPNNVHGSAVYYLKAYAEKFECINDNYDISIRVFDSLIPDQSNGLDMIIDRIMDDGPAIIAFSCYCWNIEIVLRICKIIKLLNHTVQIVLGGPEVSGNAEHYLSNYEAIDYIIDGEGEIAFEEFLRYTIGDLKDISSVHSLVYRTEDGRIKYNETEILEDLNDIPSIYDERYLDVNRIGDSFYSFETKRGCQYRCQYCFHHGGIHKIREFDTERVKRELLIILKSRLKYVWIVDPCFNENEERAVEILQFIQKNNNNHIEFGFELRNETLSERVIQELSKIDSIRFIAMGLQTLNEAALREVGREFNKEKFEENMDIIRKYFDGPEHIHIDLIYGLPKTSLADYMKAIDYAVEIGAVVFTQPLKILSGTELKTRQNEYGFICNPYSPYEVLANETFPYTDMKKAKNLNLGLYLFQLHPIIREWLKEIKEKQNLTYSEVFVKIGEYLWKKEKDYLFKNYYEYKMEYIFDIVSAAIFDLFNKEERITAEYDVTQTVRIDWGSISNAITYNEKM